MNDQKISDEIRGLEKKAEEQLDDLLEAEENLSKANYNSGWLDGYGVGKAKGTAERLNNKIG